MTAGSCNRFIKIFDLWFKLEKVDGRFSIAATRFISRVSEVICANSVEYLSGKKT